jgi:hypothetical protein
MSNLKVPEPQYRLDFDGPGALVQFHCFRFDLCKLGRVLHQEYGKLPDTFLAEYLDTHLESPVHHQHTTIWRCSLRGEEVAVKEPLLVDEDPVN